jgi:hypothetical protein
MATRKMTFSLPGDLARRFVTRVPPRERSRFLARALDKSLRAEETALVRSCLAVNDEKDALSIEKEWDQIRDSVDEPWIDAPEHEELPG